MFIGREEEKARLERLWAGKGLRMVVLYGRRRVGKTALIRHFLQDKPGVFFTASSNSAAINVENLRHAMVLSGLFSPERVEDAPMKAMKGTLESLFSHSAEKPFVLVMDEYPYLARALPELSTELAGLALAHAENSGLLLILSGSQLSFMEEHVLGGKSPFRTLNPLVIKLAPLDFFTLRRHFDLFRSEDAIRLYGIIGGTVQYLSWFGGARDVRQILVEHVLNPQSRLFEEPGHLLRQEVREGAVYNGILSAIASGAERLCDIAERTGLETGACSLYLNRLITLDLVRKEHPAGEENSRKTLYVVEHPLFRFLFRYIPQNLSTLTLGCTEPVLDLIAKDEPSYLHYVFAAICRQWLRALQKSDPSLQTFGRIGRYWGTNPKTRAQIYLDVAARDEACGMLCGKSFWGGEPVQKAHVESFLASCRGLNAQRYFVFATAGFADDCQGLWQENLSLISLDDMLSRFP